MMISDITDSYRDKEYVKSLAFNDVVTGLPNLTYIKYMLYQRDEKHEDSERIGSLLRIELTGMEHINAVLGQEQGSELLSVTAKRITNAVRNYFVNNDDINPILIRSSGPGFAIILEDVCDEEVLIELSERIKDSMARPFLIGEYELDVVIRLSAACGNISRSSISQLFKDVELALAESRKKNLSILNIFNTETHQSTHGKVSLAHDLRRAIENAGLHLNFQPKVNISNRHIEGVEALVRWNDGARGNVSPGLFVPVAEESNLILSLGEFVLESVCQQIAAWKKAGYTTIPVAVNFSAKQFMQKNIVNSVYDTLDRYNISPNNIEIELTETVVADNRSRVSRLLNEFNEAGIKTALDDFGTGYSSFSMLQDMHFDTLKIDQSFVRNIANCKRALSIINGIVCMGHELDLKIIAEGVEDDQQLRALRGINCDIVQGYYTGMPKTADELQSQFLTKYQHVTELAPVRVQ